MKRQALIAASALLLTSCAKHYVAPTGVATATLTLAASMDSYGPWLSVQNFDDEKCARSPNGNRLATFTTTGVQGKGDPHEGVDRTVPAGRPLVFSYIYQAGTAGFTDTESCRITQTFMPLAGAKYRAKFAVMGDRCVVSVFRVDGGKPEKVDDLRQVLPACNNIVDG